MDSSGSQIDMPVPVEGVAGGGTAYGWSDSGVRDPTPLRGRIDPSKVPCSDLVHVWCMPSTANVGPHELPRPLEHISLLAARNERESIQIAIRPKVSWGTAGAAGSIQIQSTDLTSSSGDRLVVGESLTFRQVVPVLGVPDALVPLNTPVCQLNVFPGETTVIWISVDIPSGQPPGQYEGEVTITAMKADTESTTHGSKQERYQIFQELKDCLDVMEPVEGKPLDEVVERVKSASSSLRRVLLSPSFSDILSDNGSVDMMDEDAITNLSVRVKLNLTVWDFILPATPSLPAVIGVSSDALCSEIFGLSSIEGYEVFPQKESFHDDTDRFGVEHGSTEWYESLDQHFRWLLTYRISPYFCRWGDGMRVLTYTCPWPADHPKSDEYYSDPRLAAYAVPYRPVVSWWVKT
ncbi:hypothetical protein Leryth_014580 [Lithospermum erythrorhizon]|nr:hypothetical protein Leryth_014580 [Lithospermum erythrorhizon]